MRHVESTLKFSIGLPISFDLLDQEIGIYINGIRCVLCFPRVDPNINSKTELFNSILVRPKAMKIISENDLKFYWGKIINYPRLDAFVYGIQLIYEIPENEISSKISNDLKIELDQKLNYVLELIEIHKRRIYFTEKIASKVSYNLNYLLDKKYIRSATTLPIAITGTVHEDKYFISKSEFIECLKWTHRLKEIKIEYQLIRRSKISHLNGDYRMSIFYSGLAVELFLTNLIRQKAKKENIVELVELLLNKYRTLKGRIDLTNDLKIEIPKIINLNDLLTLRNRSAHTGKSLSDKDASNAVKIANALLYGNEINYFID